MSSVIPKEKQTAYERWEMASFEDGRTTRQATQTPALPSAEQIAALREQARAIGHAEGLEQGRQEGLAAGRQQAAQELALLRQIAQGFGDEVAQANDIIAQDLLALALDLTRAMLKTALDVRPDLVLPIVGEAIRYLPSLQQPALLFLHPDDAQLVRQNMDDELSKAGWRVAEDKNMMRGGCRVETASNQIDASLPTRWQRLTAALGKESDWIAE
jgi:flagellar assembly protein FliH